MRRLLFSRLLLVVLLFGVNLGFAQLSNLTCATASLCSQMRMLVPLAAMLMLVLAGVIYAAGQMMGAETRARANVWATACLTGALIGILIVVVAPPVFASLLDPSMRTASGGLPCSYEDLAEIGVVCEGLGEAG